MHEESTVKGSVCCLNDPRKHFEIVCTTLATRDRQTRDGVIVLKAKRLQIFSEVLSILVNNPILEEREKFGRFVRGVKIGKCRQRAKPGLGLSVQSTLGIAKPILIV
jgi:hypothetical protein